ncbi:MAG: thioredoxin family protein [Cyclobacteriaceae bacterium]
MKIGLLNLLLLVSFAASAQMIDFEEPDWQAAVDKARSEEKLLMVYMNTVWCEPCLEMEEGVFQESTVHDFYSDNFINVPFDAEEFPGAEIADMYGVSVFPGFLFINVYGELIHKGCGWMDNDDFVQLGRDALDGEKNLSGFKKRYADGERSASFLKDYSYLLDASCVDASGFVKSFFKDRPKENWVDEESWTMISLNIFDPFSDQFEFLVSNKDVFSERYGKDTVEAKIYDVLLRQFIQIYEGEDLTLFANQALQKIIGKADFAQKSELESMVELQYSELTGDWELYGSSVVKVVEEQQVVDEIQLNEFAWKFYLFVEDQALLDVSIDWMEALLRREKSATSMDTYASLLFKSGKRKEAIKWEKMALKKAEEELEDLTHYQLQLEKFKLEVN